MDSVSANNGTLHGGVSIVPGKVGNGFGFDGTGYIVISNSPTLSFSNQLSIELWYMSTQPNATYYTIIDKRVGAAIANYGINNAPSSGLGVFYDDPTVRDGDDTAAGSSFEVSRYAPAPSPGVFHHLAATYQQLTNAMVQLQTFIDGQLVRTRVIKGTLTNTLNSSPVTIGAAAQGAGEFFIGVIDEISIYDRVLGAAEVQAIYNASTGGKCKLTVPPSFVDQPFDRNAPYGADVTFAVVAAGSLPLTYQWQRNGLAVAGATNSTLTLNNVQLSDAGSYTVVASNSAGSTTSSNANLAITGTPPCATIPSGLVSWWRAEGNARDLVGNNNGSLVNGAGFATGEVGSGFSFNGSGQFVQVPDSPSLRFTNELTVELWYKDTGAPAGSYYGLIAKRAPYPSGANFGVDLYLGTPSIVQVYLQDPNYAGYLTSVCPVPAPGMFHHIAATYRQAAAEQVELKTYIDGQLVQTGTVSGNLARTLNNAPVTIGADDPNETYFVGIVDEASVYNRALQGSEILSIYNAGAVGKCGSSIPPTITSQPVSAVATVGDSVTFSVSAGGSAPFGYQWQKNSLILDGETNSDLSITNVQLTDAGTYSVVVSNIVGIITSDSATLTVNPAPVCQQPPAGLVSWWSGQGTAGDSVGGNDGIMKNGAGFGLGEVGQAFQFTSGANEVVEIPDAPSLNPANALTIETWAFVTAVPTVDLSVIAAKQSSSVLQYQLETHNVSGHFTFRPLITVPGGLAYFDGNTSIQFNTWYHVAMTYDGSTLKLYVNGALDGSAAATGPIASSSGPFLIGGVGTGPWDLAGRVDEVSLYDRALSAFEIQSIYNAGSAGKCRVPVPPSFIAQPQNQSSTIGSTLSFTVTAGGSGPLSYQWLFNGIPLVSATNSSFVLNSVSQTNIGLYSVIITNVAGSVTSKAASLNVTFPPASLQIANAMLAFDGTVTVPVNLVANGNENAASFSVTFDPAVLQYETITLGSGAAGGSLLVNSSQASTGQIGVALALPPDVTFPVGTQRVVMVTFNSPILTAGASTSVGFADSPIKRQLADASGATLVATYAGGTVLLPPTPIEGDVYPRPNGDASLTISDWVLVGRYVAGLDSPTNASEFQRADCAPRSTLGDGLLTVSDWVQAGRYAAGLDPITRAGGPTSPVPMVVTGPLVSSIGRSTKSTRRQVRALAPMLAPGQTGTIEVALEAQGDENALAFSLAFDPSKLVLSAIAKGNGASGTTLNVNTNQAAQGKLGVVLALNANQTFAIGSKQLIQVSFRATASASGTAAVSFSDQPVPRGVCDPTAATLAADYVDAVIAVNPLPSLKIVTSMKNASLSWPASATGYVLQESSDSTLAPTSWRTVTATANVVNNETVVSVPVSANSKFYRLYHP